MEKATFALKNYKFSKVSMDISSLDNNTELKIDFNPSGEYKQEDNTYKLTINFTAKNSSSKEVIFIESISIFQMGQSTIPDFFYANSIAIIFPYIRAFISTITLQANISPVVLPTMNLSTLKETLKNNTRII